MDSKLSYIYRLDKFKFNFQILNYVTVMDSIRGKQICFDSYADRIRTW